MKPETHTKLIVLWILLLIGMILHFNYHVGEIFYGIDVRKPGADGTIPASLVFIRSVFYHLPVIFVLLLLYVRTKWFATGMYIISVIYALSHLFHLVKEVQKSTPDYSQLSLLLLVVIISVMLSYEQFQWLKSVKPQHTPIN